jgi:hypothetical protein
MMGSAATKQDSRAGLSVQEDNLLLDNAYLRTYLLTYMAWVQHKHPVVKNS